MFFDLLKIINIIRGAVKDIAKLKKESDRKDATLEMMKIYFLMLDAYNDGLKLLESVNEDPVEYIKNINDENLNMQLEIWDKVLRRQSVRLYTVKEYISSQSYISVVSPDSQEKITTIIGYKMDRVKNLHGLGSGLFFRTVFPVKETPEVTASLISDTLSMHKELIDKNEVLNELHAFKSGLNEFRAILEGIVDKKEILSLSQQAREETKIEV